MQFTPKTCGIATSDPKMLKKLMNCGCFLHTPDRCTLANAGNPVSIPLEKEMTTHSSILAREIPWTEDPGRLQFMGPLKSRTRLSH